jgi:uncharacterized membrane protein
VAQVLDRQPVVHETAGTEDRAQAFSAVSEAKPRPWNRYLIALGGIGAGAIALRAYHLGSLSLWVDEMGTATAAMTPFPQFFSMVRDSLGAAPLDYLGVKLFTFFLGHDTVATRSFAFAMGCLAVFLIYGLGTRLYNDRLVGLIGAAMLAFSAFDIYYSQEARFYSLQLTVAIVSLYAFLRALDSDSVPAWLLYGAATVLTLYTHYFLAMLLPAEGLYAAGHYLLPVVRDRSAHALRPAVRQVALCLAAQLGAVALFIPWVVFALPSQLSTSNYGVLPSLGLAKFHQIFVVLIGLAPLNSAPPAGLGQLVRTDLVLALAGTGLIWALALKRMRVLLLAAIIVLAIPLAWRLDQQSRYFWSERQVIFVLVPLYLLAAVGVRHLLDAAAWLIGRIYFRWRGLKMAAILALAALPVWMALYWSPVHLVLEGRWLGKEDWRGVAAYLDRERCPNAQFWSFIDQQYSYGFAYYAPSLEVHTHFLYVLPDGSYDPNAMDAVQKQDVRADDWIVLDTATAAAEDPALSARGWTAKSFNGIVVYHQQTCASI